MQSFSKRSSDRFGRNGAGHVKVQVIKHSPVNRVFARVTSVADFRCDIPPWKKPPKSSLFCFCRNCEGSCRRPLKPSMERLPKTVERLELLAALCTSGTFSPKFYDSHEIPSYVERPFSVQNSKKMRRISV